MKSGDMKDGYVPTKFGINSPDGLRENTFYSRTTDSWTADAEAMALALLTQSSRVKNRWHE